MFERINHLPARGAATLGVCFVVGCALIAVATYASADSTPRRLYRPTHLGVAPSDMVMLQSSGSGSTIKFVQVKPDGTIDANEYAVPTGYRLIVTDVDWAGQQPFGNAPILRIYAENKTTSTTRNVVFMNWCWISTTGGSYASGGGNSNMTTGFSISSGARLTADAAFATAPTASFPASFNNFSYSGLIVLRGYVVPDA